MFVGVEHVAIASPNPANLAGWYTDTLGFRKIAEVGVTQFIKAPNGMVLEIIQSEGDRAAQKMYDAGLRHMAIAVSDFDGALAKLRSRNVELVGEPFASPQGNRLVFFTDCEGNLLHLIQRVQPLPE